MSRLKNQRFTISGKKGSIFAENHFCQKISKRPYQKKAFAQNHFFGAKIRFWNHNTKSGCIFFYTLYVGFRGLSQLSWQRRQKIWNSVWSTLLPVSKRFSSGISCLLSGNIWFAGGITWDDSDKVARIPKNRRKWVCFHDKKSLLLFLRGQKRAKTAKIGKTKFFTQSGTLRTFGKCPKNNCKF